MNILFYLQVIEKTYDGLIAQNQNVDCIVAIRGSAVRLITTENWSFSEEQQKILEKAGALISKLRGKGIRFEACSVAMELFKITPESLLVDIQAVGNTFISLIGYQTKGYVIIPVK